MEQLVDLGGLDPLDGFVLRDQAFRDHVDRDLDRGLGRALRGARLQHPELALFDREFEVLDVAVVHLQALGVGFEFFVDIGHLLLERRDRLRRPDAGDDVLALGVRQVVAVQDFLAGVGVAGERDAGAGVVPHVAEDHGLDVDGGPQVVRDLVEVAVVDGALVVPRGEDGFDGGAKLLERVIRERLAALFEDDVFEFFDQLLEMLGL